MSQAPRPAFAQGAAEHETTTLWKDAGAGWTPLRETLPRLDQDASPTEPPPPAQPGPTYESGFQEGMQKAKQAIDGIVQRYQQSLVELAQTRGTIVQQSEADLVRLALHIAGQILLSDTAGRLDFTSRMVQHALTLLADSDRITLRVASADMSGLMAKQPQLMGMPHVTLVEDENMALGGVIAECAMGRVDATLERRLAEMGALLMDEEPAL